MYILKKEINFVLTFNGKSFHSGLLLNRTDAVMLSWKHTYLKCNYFHNWHLVMDRSRPGTKISLSHVEQSFSSFLPNFWQVLCIITLKNHKICQECGKKMKQSLVQFALKPISPQYFQVLCTRSMTIAQFIWNTEISVSIAIHCYERLF